MAKRKRNRQRNKSFDRTGGIVDKAIGVLIALCLLALVCVPSMLTQSVPLPTCAPGAVPGVVSDNEVNGILVRARRHEYVIRTESGHERAITTCVKSNCKGPYDILDKKTAGQPAHAEFCGTYLTLVALDGVPVYTASPPSQDKLDAEAQFSRGMGLFSLLFLVVVGLGVAGYIVKKRRRAPAHNQL